MNCGVICNIVTVRINIFCKKLGKTKVSFCVSIISFDEFAQSCPEKKMVLKVLHL